MAVGSLLVIVIVLLSSAWARPTNETAPLTYSYSLSVGHGSGSPFQTTGEGHITAIRIWENHNSYITGMQFKYDGIWSALVGRVLNTAIEMELRDGEVIIQISGKWHASNYIYQLQFVTNRGRFLTAGQPSGYSFNLYPVHPDAEMLLVSGRYNGNGITSIGAHWGVLRSKMH